MNLNAPKFEQQNIFETPREEKSFEYGDEIIPGVNFGKWDENTPAFFIHEGVVLGVVDIKGDVISITKETDGRVEKISPEEQKSVLEKARQAKEKYEARMNVQ